MPAEPTASIGAPSLKEELVTRALEIGFDECRIARCDEAPHAKNFLSWIDDGCHGDMAWMEKRTDRRVDPREVLPGARSVIVLAYNYFQGTENPRSHPGVIARYAWGDDYHDIIEKKLAELNAFLEESGGQQRYYVDTGPILERDFASAAGLGWNGKSTVQISTNLGTWFFLAEILTTLDLSADPPAADRCGKCTRCIDVCPTNAITQPHHLDARKCISYLTIEHKGPIPEEYRVALGDRIYGCDDCLTICPWNRFARAAAETRFSLRPEVARMKLREFLQLDDDAFRALFRKSPVKRLKRPRFLRNVCVALGNVGTTEDLPALRTAASDPDLLISEHASWAINRIESKGLLAQHGGSSEAG